MLIDIPFNELPDIWSSLSLKFAGGAGIELCKAWTETKINLRNQVTFLSLSIAQNRNEIDK